MGDFIIGLMTKFGWQLPAVFVLGLFTIFCGVMTFRTARSRLHKNRAILMLTIAVFVVVVVFVGMLVMGLSR